jgi:hypothetical protein
LPFDLEFRCISQCAHHQPVRNSGAEGTVHF